MDTTQWAQVSSTANSVNNTTRPPQQQSQQLVERRTRPLKEQALNCPRCNSTNTKFCYYNNYSLTQPRYFCKTCRRYWTEGGSLRNVPVGGGSRKNKKHSSSSSSNNASSSKINNVQPNSNPIMSASLIPKPNYQGQDLNLGFANNNLLPPFIGGNFPNIESNTSGGLSAMDLLRNTTSAMYGGGFGIHDFASNASIKFPLDSIGDGMQLFPFGDMKQVNVKSSNAINEQSKIQGGDQAIFWNGASMGGGGGSW